MVEGFNQYLKEAEQVQPLGTVDTCKMMSSNVLVDSDILISELQNCSAKTDQELYSLIGVAYRLILDDKFLKSDYNKVVIANALSDRRFAGIFCNVLSSVQLEDIQQIFLNKLLYDYLTSSNKDDMIVNMMYNLGFAINQNSVGALYCKGFSRNLVTYLGIARRSTTNETLAVRRVNVIIINQPSEIMTEQNIIYIYEELFNKSLLALFEGIMFDNWYEEDDDTELEQYQEDNYGTINLALLDIVNEMPISMIMELLSQYGQTKQYLHREDKVRFDIHALSDDHSRILQAIEMAEAQGIYIPHV